MPMQVPRPLHRAMIATATGIEWLVEGAAALVLLVLGMAFWIGLVVIAGAIALKVVLWAFS